MAALSRWNDDRLDEWAARVGQIEPVVRDVAVLRTEMATLGRAVKANTTATEHVAEQLEATKVEPLTRARDFRSKVAIAVVSACVSGGLVIIGTLLAHG